MIWQNTTNQTILIVEMDVKSKEKTYIYIVKNYLEVQKKDQLRSAQNTWFIRF